MAWWTALRTRAGLVSDVGGDGPCPSTSVESTIIRTPAVMSRMTETSRMENRSRRKMKAKVRTNMREDDLHMAAEPVIRSLVVGS